MDARDGVCECPDHQHRDAHCKHIRAVEFAIGERPIPAWIDRDAIENSLGDHIEESPVFELEPEPITVADAKPEWAVMTDGGQLLEAHTQDSSGEDTAVCDCETFDAGELPCAECYIFKGIDEVPEP